MYIMTQVKLQILWVQHCGCNCENRPMRNLLMIVAILTEIIAIADNQTYYCTKQETIKTAYDTTYANFELIVTAR